MGKRSLFEEADKMHQNKFEAKEEKEEVNTKSVTLSSMGTLIKMNKALTINKLTEMSAKIPDKLMRLSTKDIAMVVESKEMLESVYNLGVTSSEIEGLLLLFNKSKYLNNGKDLCETILQIQNIFYEYFSLVPDEEKTLENAEKIIYSMLDEWESNHGTIIKLVDFLNNNRGR